MSHWLLLVTLGFFQDQMRIPTAGFDPITGWEHFQIYRSHAGCERAAREWHDVFDSDPMYRIRCVRYGLKKDSI